MKQYSEINWLIAGKILSGEASNEERQIFNESLQYNENLKEWEDFHAALNTIDYSMISEQVDVEKAWNKVNKTTTLFHSKKIVLSFTAAASIIIALLFFYPLFYREDIYTLNTKNNTDAIKLEDGSSININRASTLEYPKTFQSDSRLVNLRGEAFFEIKRDEERPFIIRTSKLQIKVLGTSFNIKAYPENNQEEVTVKTGIVEVTEIDNAQNKIILQQGDKAIYNTSDRGIHKQTVINDNYLAWKTGNLTFKEERLEDVIKTIEEVYDVKIKTPGNTNLKTLYTAYFDNSPVEKIISTINTTLGTDLQIE